MKKRPIFQKILVPLMGLVILEILILVGSLLGQGLFQELSNNEKTIVNEIVRGRAEYLQNLMLNNWMNLDYAVNSVNTLTQRMVDEGTISIETLDDSSSAAAPFLMEATEYLVSMMRSNSVSSAYIFLNTEDMSLVTEDGETLEKPGIYLRDHDPTSQYLANNNDLLALRAPISVVQELGIAADSSWELNFSFTSEEQAYFDFFSQVHQTALAGKDLYDWQDMGCWRQMNKVPGSFDEVLTYAVPLILEDGTVYGILGIDIVLDYFALLFPYQEIAGDSQGAYFIARQTEEENIFDCFFGDGNLGIEGKSGNTAVEFGTDKYYSYAIPLEIYSRNTPYYEEQWMFGGVVPVQKLNDFSNQMWFTLLIAVLITFAVGALGSLIISYLIQKPVAALSKEMGSQDSRKEIILHDTGIREIDQMASEVEKLSRDVIQGDMKLTKIIKMASVKLAGFQIDYEKNSLFATEHFFEIFGRPDIDERELTIDEFNGIMDELHAYFLEKNEIADSYIYQIKSEGMERYIQLKYLVDRHNTYGLCEDVTQAVLEKKILQHERDHDLLTDLYNRRAFWRELQNLFHDRKDAIRIGALLMLDLDHLKYINDTYGHEYGDRYIMQMARSMKRFLPERALCARISGDEFYAFLYGSETREEIEQQIETLRLGMAEMVVELPGKGCQHIQASGGVAWYPKDSTSMEELFKYADYAMYEVKKSTRGEIRNFNMSHYEKQDEQNRSKEALNSLILNKSVQYAFQPIVDAHTGEIFAYEALMRPFMTGLTTVGEVLEAARREEKLEAIEELTWFEALEAFERHVKEGRIREGSCMFLNSIPNQRLSAEKEEELLHRYGKYMQQVVVELTEEEQIDKEKWEGKQRRHRRLGGLIAMDDYGTGYNSEKMLLTISPDFIKVDIAIVKDIDRSADKQAMVSYITNYAHERDKYIIAEGVESEAETRTLIRLGVDYLQGYFFAKPQILPEGISEDGVRVIREMQSEVKNRERG